MRYLCTLCSGLILFWLVLSGHYSILLLSLGAASVLLVVLLARQLNIADAEAQPIQVLPKLPGYLLWLSGKIVSANIDVVRRIWHPSLDIHPTHLCLRTECQTSVAKALYANSITLTPGTVCMDIGEQTLEVHALSWSAARDLLEGDMETRIRLLEK